MSQRIEVGDMVQVVRPQPCCGDRQSIGRTYIVGALMPARGYYCAACGREAATQIATCKGDPFASGAQVSLLIKIAPGKLIEEEQRDVEVVA